MGIEKIVAPEVKLPIKGPSKNSNSKKVNKRARLDSGDSRKDGSYSVVNISDTRVVLQKPHNSRKKRGIVSKDKETVNASSPLPKSDDAINQATHFPTPFSPILSFGGKVVSAAKTVRVEPFSETQSVKKAVRPFIPPVPLSRDAETQTEETQELQEYEHELKMSTKRIRELEALLASSNLQLLAFTEYFPHN